MIEKSKILRENSFKVYMTLLIISILVVSISFGNLIAFSMSAPVEKPGENINTNYIGQASVVELVDKNKTVTLRLNDNYHYAKGFINVYYTDSLGLESSGLGGGGSSKAIYTDQIEISLNKLNNEKKIKLDREASIAIISTEINSEKSEKPIIILSILVLLGLILIIYYLSCLGGRGVNIN